MNAPSPPRRLPRLRFSLRVLLFAFTAVAIGIPVWYRWPYEEEQSPLQVASDSNNLPNWRIVTTWQRQWGGGRLKHGLETTYRADGSILYVTHYVRGERHGLFEAWEPGRPETVGYYEHDKKSGTWTTDTGHSRLVENWEDGQLHGPWEFQWGNGPLDRMRFTQGRLTEVNGRPWSSPLYDAHHRRETRDESKAIADNLYSNINSPLTIDLQNVPLGSAMAGLGAENPLGFMPNSGPGTPILLDPRLPDPNLPLTGHWEGIGIDVKTALVLLLARHGLVADYHFGSVWVTTPELAGPWPDPTGIDKIAPPEGSQLARTWEQSVDVTTTWRTPTYPGEQDLAAVIAEDFAMLPVTFDTTRIASTPDDPERFPVVAYVVKVPFQHALAYLLYQAKCRCELRGETLVILPPEQAPPTPDS
jgi:hypothetical protein